MRMRKPRKSGRMAKRAGRTLHHQGLPYVPEIIGTELISRHHDYLLALASSSPESTTGKHFAMTSKITSRDATSAWLRKWSGTSPTVTSNRCHTDAYSSDFVTGLPISVDWRGNSYDPILAIVDRLKMMVH